MADVFDKATRSRIMRAIKGKDTKPELNLALAITALGLSYVRHAHGLPGSPDFVFKGPRLVVFMHGCFWHRCPRHYRAPKTRAEHWRRHISGNVRRDLRKRRELNRLGWRTMVVWEHERPEQAAERVARRADGPRS